LHGLFRYKDRDYCFVWPEASIARARNSIRIVEGVGPRTILVFNDADTVVPHEQIRKAVTLAREAPGLVYAYDLYLRLDRDGRIERELYSPPSMGCAAISRECFEQVGGFDESYSGWGYEDVDFARRCQELWPIRRVTGEARHLWHGGRRNDDSPEDSDPEQVEANRARFRAAFLERSSRVAAS